MYFPGLEKFTELSSESGLVPVFKEMVADLDTPLTLFAKVERKYNDTFLFESMEGGEKWGRYSFIGFDPLVTFSSKDDVVKTKYYEGDNVRSSQENGDPVKILKQLIHSFKAVEYDELPRFCGGAVGFLGYDMVRFMEDLPDTKEPLDFPDSSFIVPKIVLVHDSFKQTVKIVCWVRTEGSVCKDSYSEAMREIDKVTALLRDQVPRTFYEESQKGTSTTHDFSSNMASETFHGMVERAKEYIRAGDVIQVVLSQRFHTKTELNPTTLYRALRHINPSPYLFYLKFGDLVQIGSSPEILVRKEGDNIELRPIAGTRKRGATVEEDLALEKELLADPKECAEHMMLVDLGRNDVGRVAKSGSIEVYDLLVIEKYSHVMHIVSGVRGKIKDDLDQFDVMSACFPAGTVSGAPKIRAMEIIDELEPIKRGPYAGAVGYVDFNGNMDHCIALRTCIITPGVAHVQAGAGVVADSVPAKEYEECMRKAQAVLQSVARAELF